MLWYSTPTAALPSAGNNAATSDPFAQPNGSRTQATNNHHQHSHHHQSSHTNPLAALRAQENFIALRKSHIARFGACWIRPAGVAKTYQAAMDEVAERAEAERMAEREAVMADEMEGDDEEEEGWEEEDEEEGMGMGGAEGEDGVGGAVEGAEEEEEADAEVEAERDLDDDVPEAGSYQHTDTEVEDVSDEDDEEEEDDDEGMVVDEDSSVVVEAREAGRAGGVQASSAVRGRASGLSSSLMGSSPAARRGRN